MNAIITLTTKYRWVFLSALWFPDSPSVYSTGSAACRDDCAAHCKAEPQATPKQADVLYALAQSLVALLVGKPHEWRERAALDEWAPALGTFSWHTVEARKYLWTNELEPSHCLSTAPPFPAPWDLSSLGYARDTRVIITKRISWCHLTKIYRLL